MINRRFGRSALGSLGLMCLTVGCVSGQTGDAGLGAGAVKGDHHADGGATPPPDDSTASQASDTGTDTSETTSASNVANPSGNCEPEDNGARVSEHSPDATDTYLPDCALDLAREYYRVFASDDDTAYIFPRPDGNAAFATPCVDAADPLHELVQRYALCETATSEEAVDTINTMAPADALALTHFLHGQLVFHDVQDGISPPPFGADMLAVCDVLDNQNALAEGPLQERCETLRNAAEQGFREESMNALGAGEIPTLVDALNELYGIDDELCARLKNAAGRDLMRTIEDSRGCEADADCVNIERITACSNTCHDVASESSLEAIDAAKERIGDEQCAPFERAGCDLIAPPCEAPSAILRCVEGLCGDHPELGPLHSGFEEELTEGGGCGNVLLYATTADFSTSLTVNADGLLDGLDATSAETEFSFTLPDERIIVSASTGVLDGLYCNDARSNEMRVDSTQPANSGTVKITVRPDGDLFRADLELDGVEFTSGEQSVTLGHYELTDVSVGWYAG